MACIIPRTWGTEGRGDRTKGYFLGRALVRAAALTANGRLGSSLCGFQPAEPAPEPEYPTISCSALASSGGQGEETYTVTLGSDGGTVTLNFDAYGVPDRFVVTYNGSTVIDTGYRGDSGYNATLAGLGLPAVTGPGSGSASFVKPAGSPTTANVTVYAPLPGTAWEFTLGCPV